MQSILRTWRDQPPNQQTATDNDNSTQNPQSDRPTDLEAGHSRREAEPTTPTNNSNNNATATTPATTAPEQLSMACDPLTYGRGLYFGPQFIGTTDSAEELGDTVWRRVGRASGTSNRLSLILNDESEFNRQRSNSTQNATNSLKKLKNNDESNTTSCTEIHCAFNVHNIALVQTGTSVANKEKGAVEDGGNVPATAHGRYRLTFQLDALRPGKLTVAWLSQQYPAHDTPGCIAIRNATTPLPVPATHHTTFTQGVDQLYNAPDEHLLSPDELPDQQTLILRSIAEPTETDNTVNEMAPNGIIQTALTRVATAISLSNQQEDATQPDMVNACSSTNDITDIPMISLNSHTSTDIPLLILMEAESGSQSLLTFASLTNPLTDGVNSMTILLQKFRTRGQTYVLERIYGVEEEENTVKVEANSDTLPTTEETGTCVVCIADPSMVAVLPCRHLCLCMECAEELRNRSCFCPICRQAFHTMICIGDQ